ncbi:hypothetical protein DFA_09700 [Cavenderia fasciculata]|uniref:Uncharacterized protein n=1 Tax=Cavenderia fasciculata TaxID=261658 RepID=F4Q8C8_CACFS|nr:uncharacterized protein DFA_09700 [Cavenderia fasciculata]EGG16028.1 hypothetical protein DFA_09700 [Cavenderia fasciculata]|eukprot:XP_004352353.1 hypothetical protein DFA_09700 [Cavenderia fasciculata]
MSNLFLFLSISTSSLNLFDCYYKNDNHPSPLTCSNNVIPHLVSVKRRRSVLGVFFWNGGDYSDEFITN